jgi:hypothetical protein
MQPVGILQGMYQLGARKEVIWWIFDERQTIAN